MTSITFVVVLNTLHDCVFMFSFSTVLWIVSLGITAKKEQHVPKPETQALMDLLQQKAPVLTVVLRAGSLHISIPSAGGRSRTDGNRYITSDEEVRIGLQTGSGWNCSSLLILLASCQQTCMTYTIAVCTVENS
jgi:hypothetical protein